MNIQPNIDEATDISEELRGRPPISFSGPTLNIPDKSGIYLLSDKSTNKSLYVGMTQVGFRKRLKDHWDGTKSPNSAAKSSDLVDKLVDKRLVCDVQAGKRWIKKHVVVRWMTCDEFDMDIREAERYVIRKLCPSLNDQHNK